MADENITIPAFQLAAIQTRLAQLEGKQTADAAAKQAEDARALIQAGRPDEAIAAYDARIADIEARTRRYAEDSELRQALGAHTLASPVAAEQLCALLRSELVSDPDPSGGYRVRTKDFRPVVALVKERLAHPEYAHFLAPQNPGGARGATTPNAAQAQQLQGEPRFPAQPRNASEALMMRIREQQARVAPDPATDPKYDMSKPFGLTSIPKI